MPGRLFQRGKPRLEIGGPVSTPDTKPRWLTLFHDQSQGIKPGMLQNDNPGAYGMGAFDPRRGELRLRIRFWRRLTRSRLRARLDDWGGL